MSLKPGQTLRDPLIPISFSCLHFSFGSKKNKRQVFTKSTTKRELFLSSLWFQMSSYHPFRYVTLGFRFPNRVLDVKVDQLFDGSDFSGCLKYTFSNSSPSGCFGIVMMVSSPFLSKVCMLPHLLTSIFKGVGDFQNCIVCIADLETLVDHPCYLSPSVNLDYLCACCSLTQTRFCQ